MSSIEDLDQRLTAAEREIAELREQATHTHTLAAHADRDVAEFRDELRAQTRLIKALHLSQVEAGSDLAALRTEMVGRFDQVQGGLEQITRMLEGLADRD